jgi:glycosyltransferase involved in cell wall biosynthesis
MIRVLALASYPAAGAASRFRMLQYVEPLRARGIDVHFSSFLSDRAFAEFYAPGQRVEKIAALTRGAWRQLWLLARANAFDAIWIQREAMIVGPALIEELFIRAGLPLVFDFDDAIWLPNPGEKAHPLASRLLRFPSKSLRLMRLATHVCAASEYLAEHARQYNPRVTVIPTVVSRERWSSPTRRASRPLVIGWIGVPSTAGQLEILRAVLARLRERGCRFRLRLVGAPESTALPGAEYVAWSEASERQEVAGFDIGIAPLWSGPWSDGKAGFKQLQYMALGVPCVTSPWAGGRDFIRHEHNALVANDEVEWESALVRLLGDAALRARLGAAGRTLVEEKYCAEVQVDAVARVINEACAHAQ